MDLKKLVSFILGIILIFILVSCTPRRRPIQPDNVSDQVKKSAQLPGIEDILYLNKLKEDNNRMEKIQKQVEKIKQVRSASVIVIDNSVIIGVNTAQGPETQITLELKREIERRVIKTYRSINDIAVTADPDLVERIERIARQTASGKSVTAFNWEIAEILRFIPPDI